jgi:hypothetical protein
MNDREFVVGLRLHRRLREHPRPMLGTVARQSYRIGNAFERLGREFWKSLPRWAQRAFAKIGLQNG